jgi:hypothetical protein
MRRHTHGQKWDQACGVGPKKVTCPIGATPEGQSGSKLGETRVNWQSKPGGDGPFLAVHPTSDLLMDRSTEKGRSIEF